MRVIDLTIIRWMYCLTGVIGVSCAQQREQELPPQPNILWITIEDLSPHLGSYGDSNATTPNLDAFALQSIRYTNVFATAPVCSPSRSSIITGYYGSSLGTQHLRSQVTIPGTIKPFPKYLREAGYYTTNNFKEDYNFIDTSIWDHSSATAHWREKKDGQPFFSIFNLMLTHQSSIFGADSVYDKRIRRFLQYITPTSPDSLVLPPYYPSTPETRKLWARYYTNVSIVDYQFGEILRELEEDGLTENTIIFFYSDHGTGMPRHKRALHDSGMKVPFMIHIPEKYASAFNFKPGTTNDNMISFIDLVPTLLELTGISVPDELPGKPIISKGKVAQKDYIYGSSDRVDEGFELARSIRTRQHLYIRNFLPHLPLLQPNWYTDQSEIMMELNRVRTNKDLSPAQQDMFTSQRVPEELYDVENDPHQIRNLVNDPGYHEILMELRRTLKQEILKNFDTGFAPEPELIRLSKGSTPFEFAHDSVQYPLRRIVETCDLILGQRAEVADVIQRMNDPNGLVRYWSVIGARTLWVDSKEIHAELLRLLTDEYPAVQIEAAKLLVERGHGEALGSITRHMLSKDPALVLFASRSFQEVADKGNVIPEDARKAYEKLKSETDAGRIRTAFYQLYSFWALTYVFE